MAASSPLRIALISEHASPLAAIGGVDAGGQNIYVAHVARSLARAGHQVDVLTRRDDAATAAAVEMAPGVRVLHVPAGPAEPVAKEALLPYMPQFASAAEALMRGSPGYDVVHANFFMSAMAGLQLQRRLGVPMVVTFHALGLVRREHQGAADGFSAERVSIEQRIVRRARRVIAQCPQDKEDLLRLYAADEERISTVPCGVDLDEFAPRPRREARRVLGLADDDFIVLQLGRLVPRKGIDNVIRSLARLGGSRPARLLIVGGDSREPDERRTPEIARLRGVAQACGVADRVRFVGARSQAEAAVFYAAADVFVSTPWYEPFGITPLEAMGCATPVIGSAVGGIRHTVVDGVTGLLVPPHDPAALAGALARLQANPEMARVMGRAGARRVRSLFTWERVAGQLAQIYDEVSRPVPAIAAPARAGAAGAGLLWHARQPGRAMA